MPQPLLNGVVDTRDNEIARLTAMVDDLTGELEVARAEAKLARQQVARALHNLRKQLAPLYQALQMVFGELDAAAPDTGDASTASTATSGQSLDDRQKKVWDSWKSRLGITASKCIDALTTHGELNTQQLAIATGLHRSTVPTGIHALNKAGLINKNGGRFSLKQL